VPLNALNQDSQDEAINYQDAREPVGSDFGAADSWLSSSLVEEGTIEGKCNYTRLRTKIELRCLTM